jgi:3-phosphoshikimate 1-carboxyvinyltransferase
MHVNQGLAVAFPDRLAVRRRNTPVSAVVRVPGSKSITNRALVLAALGCGAGTVTLTGALQSEDTEVMIDSLRQLGFRVVVSGAGQTIAVSSTDPARRIPARQADLFVANSGTTMRFLTAMLALGEGRYRLDGVPRMRERPIQDLLDALAQLGVEARSEAGNGCPPVVVEASGRIGGRARMRGDISSQFLSGLLLALPFAPRDITDLDVVGPVVSASYVDMTAAVLRQFGLDCVMHDQRHFHVAGWQRTVATDTYAIEPDASAASYFFAAAAITGGEVTVLGLPNPSLQGDVRFVELLAQMGCQVKRAADRITVRGGPLRGIDVDMNDISDTVMTLGAVACFALGPTRIRNVAHIRHKETDRLAALAAELRRVGARVDQHDDGLTIEPAPLHGADVETYDDHRMAMSMALVGLRTPGVVIRNPGCVAKTYPSFFEDLERI